MSKTSGFEVLSPNAVSKCFNWEPVSILFKKKPSAKRDHDVTGLAKSLLNVAEYHNVRKNLFLVITLKYYDFHILYGFAYDSKENIHTNFCCTLANDT